MENEITFEKGLFGFDHLKRFLFTNSDKEENPFKHMISIEQPEIGFIIISPFIACNDYEIEIDDKEVEQIGTTNIEDINIFCIATVKQDKISVNLKSPIVFSPVTKKGFQTIIDDERYSIKHIID